ncbi:hypothetical protein RA2_00329 [Roseovarius sp. A-2]|nr:hypothetical protein RA2_00329 [Roseovarius sp. A-2]
MAKRQWLVTGWESTQVIYECEFPLSAFSEKHIESFLKRLVYKHLSHEEIASASQERNPGEEESPLLVVSRDATSSRFCMSVGTNPHYTAQAREI